jgi:hypothetical protein
MSDLLNKVKNFFLRVKEKIRSDIHKFTAPEVKIHEAPVENEVVIPNSPTTFTIDDAPVGPLVVNEEDVTTQYSPGVDSASTSPT